MSNHTPLVLFHWSPVDNRASIHTNGLSPGRQANAADWNPPHVCYAATPSLALALTHGTGALDLWMVHTDRPGDFLRLGEEWRTTATVEAWWCGTRDIATDPSLCQGCGHEAREHVPEAGCMDSMSPEGPERDRLGFCPCPTLERITK